MKSLFCLLIAISISAVSNAQSIYEAGYFIDNDGNRKECLIKKLPWKDNPTEFEWKKTISSSPKTETIEDIREFGVGQDYQFKRYILEFDMKGDALGFATKSKDPELKIQKIFLRVIVKSATSLYQYTQGGVSRFFFTNDEHIYPELLVYKVFYTPDENEKPGEKIIGQENTRYKDQLKNIFKIENEDVSAITYTQNDLKNYFKKYNDSKGDDIDYTPVKKINQTRIGIVGAVDMISMTHPSPFEEISEDVEYESTFTPRYGLFIETFIPFSKVDLSFFLEATHRSVSLTGSIPSVTSGEEDFKVDYSSLNLAFAPRFHIYLSSKLEFFVEGGITTDLDLGSESSEIDDIENNTTNYFYGGGFGSGRFKLGGRVYTSKNISRSTEFPETDMQIISAYLSINIFGNSGEKK